VHTTAAADIANSCYFLTILDVADVVATVTADDNGNNDNNDDDGDVLLCHY